MTDLLAEYAAFEAETDKHLATLELLEHNQISSKEASESLQYAIKKLRALPLMEAVVEVAMETQSCMSCDDISCWCFTRAAMGERPMCECKSCRAWRKLRTALEGLRDKT